jgi:hypothetical protein
MSFTFAQSGSSALDQLRRSSGTPIVTSELFFRRTRENPDPVVVYVALRHSDTGSGTTIFIRVPNEIWQHGVSIHTVDKRDRYSQASLLLWLDFKCWVGRPGGNNAVDKA